MQESAHQPLTASIVAALEGRRLLVILDNCEHVLPAVRDLVAALADRCPTVRVLATSREPLGLRGERVHPLPPLAWADATDDPAAAPAVRLLVERASAADPSLVLDNRDLGSANEICRRLDGMPLAVELAAARVRGLGLDGLAQRLDERFRLLRNRAGPEARHQTLRAAVGWSYDLLDTDLRELFCRAGVFAGAFTLEAAESVLAFDGLDPLEVVDGVAELVDKSMVQTTERRGGPSRFRLLETMRQFGAEVSDPATSITARRRFVAHYATWAEGAAVALTGPDCAYWFDHVAIEFDNLREAYRLALTTDLDAAARLVVALDLFAQQAVNGEPWAWQAKLLDKLPDDHPLAGEVAARAQWGARLRGDLARTTALLDRLKSGSWELSASAQCLVASTQWITGGPEQAAATYRLALEQARRDGDRFTESFILAPLSMAEDAFDRQRAASSATTALAIARDLDSPVALGVALLARAGVALHDRPDDAIALIDELLAVARSGHVRWTFATGVRVKAHALSRTGRLGEASLTYAQALDLNGVGDFGELLWYTILNIVEHLERVGHPEPAAIAAGAFLHAPAAPVDALVRRTLERLRTRLGQALGGQQCELLEHRGQQLALAELLALLDAQLRSHASKHSTAPAGS